MSKLAAFLARKPAPEALRGDNAAADGNIDLDEELFSSLGAQIGGDNETLRNLLLNANHKIGELDAIRDAVVKLVGPVSKALREFELERSEKINLQAALSNTRTNYGKLRNEVGELEKKAATFERETVQLRKDLAFAENAARSLETIRGELAIDIAARRAQIADLEGRLSQEATEIKALREDNHRLTERAGVADKRLVALETELNNARQRLVLSEDEKRALQSSFEKATGETSRITRRLAEAESNLTATQGRLRNVEANLAELVTERARLSSSLDEATERHASELATQQMRFDALQARSFSTDKLLNEARDHLTARAEEMRAFDRRLSETTLERDALAARLAQMEADLIQKDGDLRESEHQRAALLERGSQLAKAYNTKESEIARAEEMNTTLSDQVGYLEGELRASRGVAEKQIEELNTALRREKLERSVVEGALEAARKDFTRLMHEIMALQRRRDGDTPLPQPRAANAA